MMAANQALKTGGIAEAKQVIRSAAIANVAKRSVIAGGVDGSLQLSLILIIKKLILN